MFFKLVRIVIASPSFRELGATADAVHTLDQGSSFFKANVPRVNFMFESAPSDFDACTKLFLVFDPA